MKGTRPLYNDEIHRVSAAFTGTFEIHNRSLFIIGVSTGGRISELLGLLRLGDAYQNSRAVTDLLFDKSVVKGGEVSEKTTCLCPANSFAYQSISNEG